MKTRKVLAIAMATTEQIELDKNLPNPMKVKSEAMGRSIGKGQESTIRVQINCS